MLLALVVRLATQTAGITKKEDDDDDEINLSGTDTDGEDDLSWAHTGIAATAGLLCAQGMCRKAHPLLHIWRVS